MKSILGLIAITLSFAVLGPAKAGAAELSCSAGSPMTFTVLLENGCPSQRVLLDEETRCIEFPAGAVQKSSLEIGHRYDGCVHVVPSGGTWAAIIDSAQPAN
jgi:hypothetical protein